MVKGDHVQLGTSSMHPTWGLGHSLGASRSTYTEPSFCDIFQYLSVDINTLRVFQLERKTVSRTINELGALFPVKNILQINIYIYIRQMWDDAHTLSTVIHCRLLHHTKCNPFESL